MGFSISTAMVFDIKIENFHRKAHLVARGHMTHTLNVSTYSSVVTRESVCIALTNAYVMAPNQEKIWTVFSPEFGDDTDKSTMKVRAQYSLKSTVASFRAHLAQCM